MFNKLFKKKKSNVDATSRFVIAELNARIQPMHRGEFFEDPLNEELQRLTVGEVTGGGTMQMQSGEIQFCDIEIELIKPACESINTIIATLERLGAPKGSRLIIESENREVPFGVSEGLAVYLNGTDLPDDVYQSCDSNFVYSEFDRLLEDDGRVFSYWQGPTETAFYLYGASSDQMKTKISEFIASYPLCQKCRLEQIA